MATLTKLKSGSWPVQMRRKGKDASDTFLRRGDAEVWARKLEHKIDRGDPILCDPKTTKSFASLIDLRCNIETKAGLLARKKSLAIAINDFRSCFIDVGAKPRLFGPESRSRSSNHAFRPIARLSETSDPLRTISC